jgi:TRAP-type C4-dicarboxylate transport system permease small subunit
LIPQKVKEYVDRLLESVLIVLMGANVFNVLWQVFTRFILRHPSSFTEELARYLLIWVGLLGASYAAGKKMHLAIDVIVQVLKRKTRIWVELFIQVFIFLFAFLVMGIGGLRLVTTTLALGQISAALGVKLGYIYLVLPVSGMLIMFYSSLSFIQRIQVLSGKRMETEKAMLEIQEGI